MNTSHNKLLMTSKVMWPLPSPSFHIAIYLLSDYVKLLHRYVFGSGVIFRDVGIGRAELEPALAEGYNEVVLQTERV